MSEKRAAELMNRLIKFRAWEKSLKQMIPIWTVDFECQLINTLDGQPWRTFRDIELMQFTGLKDKNGREIYENDILHYQGKVGNCLVKVEYYEGAFGAFINEDNAERLGVLPCFHSFYNFSAFSHREGTNRIYWEILGNIYENPKLMGKL